MRIVFFSHSTQIRGFAELARGVRAHSNLDPELWTLGGPDLEVGQKHDVFSKVRDLAADLDTVDVSDREYRENLRWFRQLEEEVGTVFLHRDMAMDRYFREASTAELLPSRVPVRWTERRATALLRTIGETIRSILLEMDVGALYMETNSAPYRLAWRLAKQHDTATYLFLSSRYWPKRGYFETELDFEWNACRKVYRRLSDNGMRESLKVRAAERLETIRAENEKPSYSENFRGISRSVTRYLNVDKLVREARRWVNSFRSEWRRNPRVLPSAAISPLGKAVREFDNIQSNKYYERLAKREVETEGRYAVYFLHLPREVTTMGMAFEYQDQVATIRNIVARLPADVPLYVKEHPAGAGRRGVETYAELAHEPSLHLIHHEIDSHYLIQNASLVLTLVGTVGLESIYYGIPAIILGNVFFHEFEGLYHPEGYSELGELLAQMGELQGASEQDAVRVLAAMYEASVVGAHPRNWETKPELLTETARQLADQIQGD